MQNYFFVKKHFVKILFMLYNLVKIKKLNMPEKKTNSDSEREPKETGEVFDGLELLSQEEFKEKFVDREFRSLDGKKWLRVSSFPKRNKVEIIFGELSQKGDKKIIKIPEFQEVLKGYKSLGNEPEKTKKIEPEIEDVEKAEDVKKAGSGKDVEQKETEEIRDPEMAGAEHTFYKFRKSEKHTVADFVPEDRIKVSQDEKGDIKRMDINYEPGDPKRKKEMDAAMNEKFVEMTKKLWDTFITHGYAEEQEDGSYKMTKEISDLDGESCLALLREAGLDTSKVKYVPQGEGGDEEGLVMDTSDEDGIVSRNSGKTLIADHHGEKSGRDTSATKFTYELLIANGLLEKKDYYQDFVDFVTDEDNKTYFEGSLRENFKKSWKTLRGLNQYMHPSDIVNLFKESRAFGKVFDPDEPLPDEFLKSYTYKAKDLNNPMDAQNDGKTLEVLGYLVRGRITRSEKAISNLEKEGFVFDTGDKNFGKILVDPGKEWEGKTIKSVSMGHDAVRAAGYGGYLIWNPLQNGFALFTTRPLSEVRFTQGKNIRGNFWLKPRDKETIQVTLEEILSELSKKRTKIPDSMRKALETRGLANVSVELPENVQIDNKKEIEKKEISPSRWRWIGFAIESYSQSAKDYLELLRGGKLFAIPGNTEEEKNKNLKEKIEKFLRDGFKEYNEDLIEKEKFSQEEVDIMVEESLKNIFNQ
jgi:hypothetical protein